jgi:hypothetical protein
MLSPYYVLLAVEGFRSLVIFLEGLNLNSEIRMKILVQYNYLLEDQ